MNGKRAFDFCLALLGLILLLPALLFIALWIKIDSEGPVLFRQKRVGRWGVIFRIHKFRTMQEGAEKSGLQITLGNDKRITRCGMVLRKYKLDELPQLIDVLIGKMSIVGPRPEVPQYVEHYPKYEKGILMSVRPGITNLASIYYRSESEILSQSNNPELTYIKVILPAKLRMNIDYIKSCTYWGDLKIIIQTLRLLGR